MVDSRCDAVSTASTLQHRILPYCITLNINNLFIITLLTPDFQLAHELVNLRSWRRPRYRTISTHLTPDHPAASALTFAYLAQLAVAILSTLSELPLPSISPYLHTQFKMDNQKALVWSTIMSTMEETTAAISRRKRAGH